MNIIVILRNIKKTDNSISADYYPEGEKLKGFMKIRIKDGEILEHDNASSFSAAHVLRELKRLAKSENPPKEKTLLWY